jgi:Protein of unknown function (DUF2934)
MASNKAPAAPAPRAETGKAISTSAGGALPHQKVAERAYQIWLASGCPPGHHEQDWFQAERELRAVQAGQRPSRR